MIEADGSLTGSGNLLGLVLATLLSIFLYLGLRDSLRSGLMAEYREHIKNVFLEKCKNDYAVESVKKKKR